MQKEALQALAEAAKIFIHFLTATANEVCHESKRLTISASDVLQALEEVDFPEYVQPLKEALAGAPRSLVRTFCSLLRPAYKAANAAAAALKTETKKRKAAEAADAAGAGAETEAAGPADEEA